MYLGWRYQTYRLYHWIKVIKMKRCATCRYFDVNKCRINPPSLTYFPKVEYKDWCGQWNGNLDNDNLTLTWLLDGLPPDRIVYRGDWVEYTVSKMRSHIENEEPIGIEYISKLMQLALFLLKNGHIIEEDKKNEFPKSDL